MNCLINSEKIRESIIDEGMALALESGLFERTGPSSIKAISNFTTQHQGYINGINQAFQDNLISVNPEGEFTISPSQDLIEAYESKLAPEIEAQTNQINNGSAKTLNPFTMTRIQDYLNRIGVEVRSMEEIIVDGKKLNADGVALPMQSLILHVTGKENLVLTEEAMHIGVELLSQKNPELYKEMYSKIVNYPIYGQTFRDYKDIKEYQKDGKPDINKIKKEAMGKLLTDVFLGNTVEPAAKNWWGRVKAFLGKLFAPMRQEMDEFRQGVDAIINDDLGTSRETLLQSPEYLYEMGFKGEEIDRIINMSKSMMTDAELRIAIGDMSPKLLFMKATPTVERQAKKLLDEEDNITEDKGQILYKGKPVKGTDNTIAVRKLGEKMAKTNPLYKGLEDSIVNNEKSESHLVAMDVLGKYLDKDGFPKPVTVDSLIVGKSSQYETIARAIVDKINSFPIGTKFLTDVQLANKDVAATVDLIAIDPTETFHLLNYQEISLKKGERLQDEQAALVPALQAKIEVARGILDIGYQISNFGETRTMLINVRDESGVKVTEATLAKTPAMDYLAPIPTQSETTGSKLLDSIFSEMYNIDKKKRVITGRKTERELQNNKTLTGLLSSFRALQISRTVEPLARQISNLAENMEALSEKYKSEIKGKNLASNDPTVKQFIEDMSVYLTIGETLKRVHEGVTEVNSNAPGSVERHEMKKLGRVTGELNEAFSTLNLEVKNLIDSFVAQPRGIRDINNPELVQSWLARGSRTSSMSSQASIQLLHKLAAEGSHKTELRHNDFLKKLGKVKDTYVKYMKSKGITNKQALDQITQKSPEGNYIHKLIEKIDKTFYEKAKEALKGKDIAWVKDNIDLKAYDTWFQAQKEDQFAFIEANTHVREDEDIAAVIDEYQEEWLDRFDISRGLNETNTQIYNFPLESKFLSEGYKKLTQKGNEPALELYNLIQEMNERAVNTGALDAFVGKTFIPFRNKTAIDSIIFGQGLNGDKASKDFFKSTEDFYHYGDYTPNSASKRSIPFHLIQDIAKRHINEKGEVVVDYSNVSTDVFDLLAAYNYQTESYENYSDLEATSQLLVAVEKSKPSKATSSITGNAIEGGGNVENIHNLAALEKHMLAEVYGKKYDDLDINGVISLSLNAASEMMNRKFGTNLKTDRKDIKIPVKDFLDQTRTLFIAKTLGVNPATAIVNYLGTNMQAFVDSGVWFTKTQFMKNSYKLFSENTIGKMSRKEKTSYLGGIDLLIPLVDNEDNQIEQNGSVFSKKGMKLDQLAKFNFGHELMRMLRASDRPVQHTIAASYLENTIKVGDELVNAREYLNSQPKYLGKYDGTEESKKQIEKDFEVEVQALIAKDGYFQNIEFDSDGQAFIRGIERDSDTVIKLRERIQQLSKNATGMGTNNEYRLFNASLVGRNLSTFFSWAPRLIDKRFQDLRYVTALDRMEWGRLRTTANWINNGLRDSGASLIDMYNVSEKGSEALKQEFQRQVDKYESNTGKHFYERGANEEFNRKEAERNFIEMYQRNIKATTTEFLMMAGLFVMLFAIAKLPPDDTEYEGIHKYASKVARKALGEISFFYNPLSILDLTNGKVFPGAAVIKDSLKTFGAIHDNFFGTEEQQEKAKPLGKFFKMIPGLSQLGPIMAMFDEATAKELSYQLPDATIQEPTHNNN